MKNKKVLLFISLLLICAIFFLRFFFGIKSKFLVFNILVIIAIIFILFLNVKNIFKLENKVINIIHLIMTIVVIVMTFHYLVFLFTTHLFVGSNVIINEYKISNTEVLQNVRFSGNVDAPPLSLIYERKLFFGIKCSVELKINLDNNEPYDLKKEYQELKKKKNTGFCYHKISKIY